jgi:ubiquinone biosynthesis monooxygenase Coq7
MPTADRLIALIRQSLRTVFAPHHAARPDPSLGINALSLSDKERTEAGALMRVNHVGEVCAQALYAAQAMATRNPQLRGNLCRPARKKPTTWHGQKHVWPT